MNKPAPSTSIPPALVESAITRLTGVPRVKRKRRWPMVLAIVFGVLATLYALLPVLIPVPWLVAQIETAIAGQLRVASVTIDANRSTLSWSGVVLGDVTIQQPDGFGQTPLFHADAIRTDFSPLRVLFTGRLARIEVLKPTLCVAVNAQRQFNLERALPPNDPTSGDLPTDHLIIRQARVRIENHSRNQVLIAGVPHFEAAVSAGTVVARGELLDEVELDGQTLLDVGRAEPIRFDMQLDVQTLNPRKALFGRFKLTWDDVDLRRIDWPQTARSTTGDAAGPVAVQPAALVGPDLSAITRVSGQTSGELTMQVDAQTWVTASGNIELANVQVDRVLGPNAEHPLRQDRLAVEFRGRFDPFFSETVQLDELGMTGDGWKLLPGSRVNAQPHSEQPLTLALRAELEPARLANVLLLEALGTHFGPGVIRGDVDFRRTLQRDEFAVDVDLTAVDCTIGPWLSKPAMLPLALGLSGMFSHGSGAALQLRDVNVRGSGAVAKIAAVDVFDAHTLHADWQMLADRVASLSTRQLMLDAGALARRTLGNVTFSADVRVDDLAEVARYVPRLAPLVASEHLAGGFHASVNYRAVDRVTQSAECEVLVESSADTRLKIGDWLDKPGGPQGRLFAAQALWAVNVASGWTKSFTARATLGTGTIRLGDAAQWRLDFTPNDKPLATSARGALELPIEVSGVEAWIAASPVASRVLADHDLTGDVRLLADVLVDGEVDFSTPTPEFIVQQCRVLGELNGQELGVEWQIGRGQKLFSHRRGTPMNATLAYRYAAGDEVPHEVFADVVLAGARLGGQLTWNRLATHGAVHLAVTNARLLLTQWPTLRTMLESANLGGSAVARANWTLTRGERTSADLHAKLDLDDLRLTVPQIALSKLQKVPMHVDVAGQLQLDPSSHGRFEVRQLSVALDAIAVQFQASGQLAPMADAGGLWLPASGVTHSAGELHITAQMTDALRQTWPISMWAFEHGLTGSANSQVTWSAEPNRWRAELALDASPAAFRVNDAQAAALINKPADTPAAFKAKIRADRYADRRSSVELTDMTLALGKTHLAGRVHATSDARQLTRLDGDVRIDVPAIEELATLLPRLGTYAPAGGIESRVAGTWQLDEPPAIRDLAVTLDNVTASINDQPIGLAGQIHATQDRLELTRFELTVGQQTLKLMADLTNMRTKPAGRFIVSTQRLNQPEWLASLLAIQSAFIDEETATLPSEPPANYQPIPTDSRHFATRPELYAPAWARDFFPMVRHADITGLVAADDAEIEFGHLMQGKIDGIRLPITIRDGRFTLNFEGSREGGYFKGYLAWPLDEPNPMFELRYQMREFLRTQTGSVERFPGLTLYGLADPASEPLTPLEYDPLNPAVAGERSFYTLIDESRARLFGPLGAFMYEGEGNWHVGTGRMIFGPGYLEGPDIPAIRTMFPGLDTRRVELRRVYNWFEKTADGYQIDRLSLLGRPTGRLRTAYNFYAESRMAKRSTPDPDHPGFLLGNQTDVEVGIDLLAKPDENWVQNTAGRVAIVRKTGFIPPPKPNDPPGQDSWLLHPARRDYPKGLLLLEESRPVPLRTIRDLLVRSNPLGQAYQAISRQIQQELDGDQEKQSR